ncbi:hypothetical protein CSOJ01_00471 [Colletotrichum sojae]|uniref:Uncharacterized protein n=1 Tax=Colletotrichum sojae TaxID=2175907 RepID=A0A8H6JYK3_9PEZI|nr:hypothetical protein CSOJ01_00471 [Colletotrichum sojae]
MGGPSSEAVSLRTDDPMFKPDPKESISALKMKLSDLPIQAVFPRSSWEAQAAAFILWMPSEIDSDQADRAAGGNPPTTRARTSILDSARSGQGQG